MSAVFARPAYHDALARLADRHLLRDLAYVGGRWVAGKSGKSFEVTDPASSATLAWVASLGANETAVAIDACLLYTSPSPRDRTRSRMPSSA